MNKINGWLSKLVGPNAAHMIDAGIALAIAAGVTLAASPAARAFEQRHSLLGVIVSVGVLLGTPLVSKFRKAAGAANVATADEIATAVAAALAKQDATATPKSS